MWKRAASIPSSPSIEATRTRAHRHCSRLHRVFLIGDSSSRGPNSSTLLAPLNQRHEKKVRERQLTATNAEVKGNINKGVTPCKNLRRPPGELKWNGKHRRRTETKDPMAQRLVKKPVLTVKRISRWSDTQRRQRESILTSLLIIVSDLLKPVFDRRRK